MTITLIRDGEYARLMPELPTPVRSLTLGEIEAQHERVYDELEHGGAIRVYTNDMEHFVGVLTRKGGLLGDAFIGQLIENGHLPPLDELLAMDDRGELP